jgi:hypothetical protein
MKLPNHSQRRCSFGGTGLVGFNLNARELLLGKTVKVWPYTPESFVKGDPFNGAQFRDPLTRYFTEDSVVEESQGKKSTRKITWEGNGYCRVDMTTQQKRCYGIVLATLRGSSMEVADVEILSESRGVCPVSILGRVEGVTVPPRRELEPHPHRDASRPITDRQVDRPCLHHFGARLQIQSVVMGSAGVVTTLSEQNWDSWPVPAPSAWPSTSPHGLHRTVSATPSPAHRSVAASPPAISASCVRAHG